MQLAGRLPFSEGFRSNCELLTAPAANLAATADPSNTLPLPRGRGPGCGRPRPISPTPREHDRLPSLPPGEGRGEGDRGRFLRTPRKHDHLLPLPAGEVRGEGGTAAANLRVTQCHFESARIRLLFEFTMRHAFLPRWQTSGLLPRWRSTRFARGVPAPASSVRSERRSDPGIATGRIQSKARDVQLGNGPVLTRIERLA